MSWPQVSLVWKLNWSKMRLPDQRETLGFFEVIVSLGTVMLHWTLDVSNRVISLSLLKEKLSSASVVLRSSGLENCTAQVHNRSGCENRLLLSCEQLRLIIVINQLCCRLFISSRNAKQLATHLML